MYSTASGYPAQARSPMQSSDATPFRKALDDLKSVHDVLRDGISQNVRQYERASDKHSALVSTELYASNQVHAVCQQVTVTAGILSNMVDEQTREALVQMAGGASKMQQELVGVVSAQQDNIWDDLLTPRPYTKFPKKTFDVVLM